MKRVAIQLYGHLRSYKKTYKSLMQNIIEANSDVSFDIFIHTWDEIDCKQAPLHYDRDVSFAGLKLTEKEKNDICNLYNPLKVKVEAQLELTDNEKLLVKDVEKSTACKNMMHTFCAVNKMRKSYEQENGFEYDLVITTRPDILFYDKLDLSGFFARNRGWEKFKPEDLINRVFSTYINGYNQVINQEVHIPAVDLLMLSLSGTLDLFLEWENCPDMYLTTNTEHSISKMINKCGIKHSFIVYEKDKCWTILRVFDKSLYFADILYKLLKPFLLKSRLYCRNTYANVTTYKNKQKLEEYLNRHIR